MLEVGYGSSRRLRAVQTYIVVRLESDGQLVRFEVERPVARALQAELGASFGRGIGERRSPKFKITYYPVTRVIKNLEREDNLNYISTTYIRGKEQA